MTIKSKGLVLIGFAEALSAPEVAWSLVEHGYTVQAFVRRGRRTALRHSKYVTCHEITAPEADVEVAVAELRSLLESLKEGARDVPLVLFPLDDNAVWVCDKVADESGWMLAGPTGGSADAALNKDRQMNVAMRSGLNVPETRIIEQPDQFDALDLEFPIIMRPAQAVFQQENRLRKLRKWICQSQDELDAAIQEWAGEVPLVVQPYFLGTGEGVFGLAVQGGIRAWSAHRRVRMMNPHGSGSSACESQKMLEELKIPITRFLKDSGWSGLFMIELLRDSEGEIWFIEFNGRPWGSMALARRQGLEYPAWTIDLMLNSQSIVGLDTKPTEARLCRHFGREFMHMLFVFKGPKSRALTEWPSTWSTFTSLANLNRYDAAYNWSRDDPKVFFYDFYYTIYGQIFKPKR